MTVEERAREWLKDDYQFDDEHGVCFEDGLVRIPEVVTALAKFAEAERRATITACLDVVNAERDAAKKCAKLSEKKEFYAKVYAQTEIAATCERIATRLKQLEEQK